MLPQSTAILKNKPTSKLAVFIHGGPTSWSWEASSRPTCRLSEPEVNDLVEYLKSLGDEGDFPTSVGNGDDGGGTIPQNFTLRDNYPNPFNPNTTIEYELPQTGGCLGGLAAALFGALDYFRLPSEHVAWKKASLHGLLNFI